MHFGYDSYTVLIILHKVKGFYCLKYTLFNTQLFHFLQTGGVEYVGCVKDIVIEGKQIQVEDRMLRGNMMSHICPTI